jgi:heterodisulfide reductase subunit B
VTRGSPEHAAVRRRDPYLHRVIEALGGPDVDYAGAYTCCGFPILTMNRDASLRQAATHLGDAQNAGADCLVVPCPLCHLNLDLLQPSAARAVSRKLAMPVLHLPQLVGLALGLDPGELGHAPAPPGREIRPSSYRRVDGADPNPRSPRRRAPPGARRA